MPKRFNKRAGKSYAKRKGAPRARRGGRRLQSAAAYAAAEIALGGGAADIKRSRQKGTPMLRTGRTRYSQGERGRSGAPAVDAAAGAAGGFSGFRVGKKKRMATVLAKRKTSIMSIVADNAFPVIKDHQLVNQAQLDWSSGTQGVGVYSVGYTTAEIQNMLTQSQSANSVATASLVAPAVLTTLSNQKMDYYDKTSKYNFKNTSSHTVYMEIQAYNCIGFHGFAMREAWIAALTNDDMLQNSATFGTEQVYTDIGSRPNFKMADMNVRWRRQSGSNFKTALEPGQETSYTFVQPGGRFDQMRFNVQQGNTGQGVDVTYGPFTSQIMVFARAEMVADRLDTDVTYGSGHLAVNAETWKSWAAVPYSKPQQSSFTNSWGTVIESDELDINQTNVDPEAYFDQT